MNRFLKHLLSVILVMQTCVTGLPSSVFAEENFPEETEIPTEETAEEIEEAVSIAETAE